MTEKIYEYKDEQNWFIGKWGGLGLITLLGDTMGEELYFLNHELGRLLENDETVAEDESYDVTIVKMASDFHLIRFIVEMIAQETGRDLAVRQHQGSILVTEGERIRLVHLPAQGVTVNDFFGQTEQGLSDFGDTILIATKNEGKTKEFRKMFERLGLKVENLNDYPDLPDVEETGVTFEENARLKAETIAELTGKMVLADDSGLKVDVLGGMPGVWSARFSGPGATDASNNAKLLHELAMVFDQKDRSAQFHCTLVVAKPGADSLVVEADWDGYIAFAPKGEEGFGYDPLFLVGETGKTSAEFGVDYKNEHSHRALALQKLLEVFPTWQATHS
ncbi:nucleoside-triphosphate diphosphatase [Streptococcus caprae]|uniref:dITP/XTP pyrophosphatase n=1 Tax=Streptococcus caprae TaxID=1640501 RepID=A0ABV8CXX1_9STRE